MLVLCRLYCFRDQEDRQRVVSCWNCGDKGHIARNCTVRRKHQQQLGNGRPTMLGVQHEGETCQQRILSLLTVNGGLNYHLKGFVTSLPIVFVVALSPLPLLRSWQWARQFNWTVYLPYVHALDRSWLVYTIPRNIKGVGISATLKVTLDDLTVEAILSSDFLEMHKCVIDVNGVV